MSESSPILMQIHDEFDTYERYPYTDHSLISNIRMASHPNGYRITTYPGGSGYGFDGFAIDVSAQAGIFSDIAPNRVETSRDYGGIMVFQVGDVHEDEDGITILDGTLDTPAAREGLVLPGDQGFELFTQLHHQLRNLKDPLKDSFEVAGVAINPTAFNFSESTGTSGPNKEGTARVHYRTSVYDAGDANNRARVTLDATQETEFTAKPSDLVVYRSGILEEEESQQPTELSMEALLAFSGLHGAISKLYGQPSLIE